MDIKELRLGNFVEYNGVGVIKVTADLFEKYNHLSIIDTQVRAISITDQWLREFGFTQDRSRLFLQIDFGENWKWEGWQFVSSAYHSPETLQTWVYLYDKREWPLGKPMVYVHQLQNLYYSLTHKELQHYAKSTTGTN